MHDDAVMMASTYDVVFLVGRHHIARQHRPHVIFTALDCSLVREMSACASVCAPHAPWTTDGIKRDHFKGGVTGAIVRDVATFEMVMPCEACVCVDGSGRRSQSLHTDHHHELRSVGNHRTVTSEDAVSVVDDCSEKWN